MSIFAVLHLWAFPWRPYTIANQEMSNDPEYFGGKIVYQGGPLGLKAYLNAFNPMDLLKAIGRGFRWLFVGRKSRHLDASYNQSPYSIKPDHGDSNIPGKQHTGYGGKGSAAELVERPGVYGEENEQLLAHVQSNPSGDVGIASSDYEAPENYETRYGRPHEEEVALRPVSPQPYQAYHPQSTPYPLQTLHHPQPPSVSSYPPHIQDQEAPPAYPQSQDEYAPIQMPPEGQHPDPYLPHAK
jgi:hypothetical protein